MSPYIHKSDLYPPHRQRATHGDDAADLPPQGKMEEQKELDELTTTADTAKKLELLQDKFMEVFKKYDSACRPNWGQMDDIGLLENIYDDQKRQFTETNDWAKLIPDFEKKYDPDEVDADAIDVEDLEKYCNDISDSYISLRKEQDSIRQAYNEKKKFKVELETFFKDKLGLVFDSQAMTLTEQ